MKKILLYKFNCIRHLNVFLNIFFILKKIITTFFNFKGFDCSLRLQDILENSRPFSINCKIASESVIFPTQEEIQFVFRNLSDKSLSTGNYSFENRRSTESENYSNNQELQFGDGEEIKRILIKFDVHTKLVVSITFTTASGKNFFLAFAQISAYEKMENPSQEEVIEIQDNETVLSFFGHFLTRPDNGKNYLAGLGVHVYRVPTKADEVENFDYFKEDEELPSPPNNWNQGKFQLIVNYCRKCTDHKGTTWHEEAVSDNLQKKNEKKG